jgi:hypothetical protein
MRYRLMRSEGTATNVPIKQGRRYVGSVRPDEAGRDWIARIGPHVAPGFSIDAAFREVAARAMGFANLAALRAHNRGVRVQNRVNRIAARTQFRRGLAAGAPQAEPGPIPDEPF